MPTFSPTPEQTAILTAARERPENLLVRAYAGCGKTTTLVQIAQALPDKPGLALAFNVKIKKELEKRMPANFEVKTLNGLGHSAWARAINSRCEVDDRKLGRLVTAAFKEADFAGSTEDWNAVRQLVSAAMRAGLVPAKFNKPGLVPDTPTTWHELAEDQMDRPEPALLELAQAVLEASIREAFLGMISFDDQIYCSAMLGGLFPRFPLVLVDEAQDLSLLNHRQVQRTAAGRLIVVGDSKQAIYQFRGADATSIERLLALRKDWIELPLATTFRCPRAIVARQQEHAPGFLAHHTNSEGSFARHVPTEQAPYWGAADLQGDSVAVLCRNNAPLLKLAFKLLAQQVGVVFLGRDIGKSLVSLAKKICKPVTLPAGECILAIAAWSETETTLARAKGNDAKADSIADRAEALEAVLAGSGAKDAAGLVAALERLFARDTGQVTLATGHRAKGLEWHTVVHLDPWRIPSKFAQHNRAAMQQERNLLYVIETRAQEKLLLANMEDFA